MVGRKQRRNLSSKYFNIDCCPQKVDGMRSCYFTVTGCSSITWVSLFKVIVKSYFNDNKCLRHLRSFGSDGKASAYNTETRVRSLGPEAPLEKEMATHSSTLAWKIPWTEESDRLQPMGSQKVGHDWATSLSFFLFLSFCLSINWKGASLVAHLVKNPPAMQESLVQFLGREDPLEKG